MSQTCEFADVGRLPESGDNVAIATQRLEAGQQIRRGGETFRLNHTIMEGHRFAAEPIEEGAALLSWGLPFGRALRPIGPGEYACNRGMLDALAVRQLDFELPRQPNFEDLIESYQLDEAVFRPGKALPRLAKPGTFTGYARPGGRGVGTRNYIVVLGTSSRTAGYARQLAERLRGVGEGLEHFDGVVAVAHTEGGGLELPNNRELLLRTLAGFATHANIGALLAVDYGSETVNNQTLRAYMEGRDYPLQTLPHRFLSIRSGFARALEEGEAQVRQWLEGVSACRRSARPLDHLKIALQCGGSDAFSGISGNPLAAWVARELICHGGSANLAETDELIGAEPYVLQNARDLDTARRFLQMIERFKERVAWHGESAEGNPSGGNKFRGLYNIALKSIGAAQKRHPEARLDYCIDYGEPMREGGYYFMDSPGNDLESIAGQVASGCNVIFFVTGNGSITNFPFVPTLKIVTTTRRFELLERDMDVNAGAYLDGRPMDELGRELFALTLEVAGGQRSKGERAGHAQVQIWRNWKQCDEQRLEELRQRIEPPGERVPIEGEAGPNLRFAALRTGEGHVSDRVGLVLPTSLCSGQVARMIAERLNARQLGRERGFSRFVALVHTEGCGVSGGEAEKLYARTLLGYLTHPLVGCALLLEHGCEKTHNDYMKHQLAELGLEAGSFGWASVQLDGGIERVVEKVEAFFAGRLENMVAPAEEEVGLEGLHVGLLSAGPLATGADEALARLSRWIAGAGGTVIVPEGDALLASRAFARDVLAGRPAEAGLAYGQRIEETGFYIMENPTDHWGETLTGLGSTGVEMVLAHTGEHPLQGHPLVPLVQVSAAVEVIALYGEDLDLSLEEPASEWSAQMLDLLAGVAARRCVPRALAQRNTDFQLTRGLLGVSL